MRIGDEIYIHGYVDEIRKDVVIVKNGGGYFGTIPTEIITTKDDCISRKDAVDACLNGWNKGYEEIVADIRTLPILQPKKPTGHWQKVVDEKDENSEKWHYECSVCGWQGSMFGNDNYCAHCGAKMT